MRTLTFHIFRFDPQLENDQPRVEQYQLEETDGMTLFIALNAIREHQAPDLKFDFVCRAGICGSSGMVVNGTPVLACRTLTSQYTDGHIHLHPLPGFELIGDLSVNTGKFMRALSERIGAWLHSHHEQSISIHQIEARMEPAKAEAIYELDRCIECGCCVSACATKAMKDEFIGAVGMIKLARFALDPRDSRTSKDYYEVLGNENGVFGCMTLLGCQDVCPKNLSHQTQIAYLRRQMLTAL
ncbi:fumarate reductase iron-sulfur subunit [Alteromonas sediminis]|uniref:succinate dehydrogenase n=1 Tax=Alteromonas sediminis TaxID=2259342 RepID=A0A3N5Y591_9ALTE|nr:fumarate reductase iron-sulfur subunit [Alteromonas sediminis]RPJ68176.1 fumarate reductase iron-sulfur subunit [Alteromonas sediminis]